MWRLACRSEVDNSGIHWVRQAFYGKILSPTFGGRSRCRCGWLALRSSVACRACRWRCAAGLPWRSSVRCRGAAALVLLRAAGGALGAPWCTRGLPSLLASCGRWWLLLACWPAVVAWRWRGAGAGVVALPVYLPTYLVPRAMRTRCRCRCRGAVALPASTGVPWRAGLGALPSLSLPCCRAGAAVVAWWRWVDRGLLLAALHLDGGRLAWRLPWRSGSIVVLVALVPRCVVDGMPLPWSLSLSLSPRSPRCRRSRSRYLAPCCPAALPGWPASCPAALPRLASCRCPACPAA